MSSTVSYQSQNFPLNEGETVLDGLLRQGASLPYSCKTGTCQSCMLQCVKGEVPARSQQGLKPTKAQKGFFLACQCTPEADITVRGLDEAGEDIQARITHHEMLNHNVMRLSLTATGNSALVNEFEPGQYLTLMVEGTLARSYSIANNPRKDGFIELHIRLLENGQMSHWLRRHAGETPSVILRGAYGHCFYNIGTNNAQDFPILLAGTGTGLAPLYGIVQEALRQGHQGPIQLFHGARNTQDLYLVEQLQALGAQHANFTYTACVLEEAAGGPLPTPQGVQIGDISHLTLASMPKAAHEKAALQTFLCGAPEFVNALKTKIFLAGAASANIFVDAFVPSKA